jgi:hypothetical protein
MAAVLAVTGLFAPSAQAVPIVQTQIVLYGNSNFNSEIGRQGVAGLLGGCYDEVHRGYWYLPYTSQQNSASSVLLWVPSGYTKCNAMWVEGLNGQWWGTCISHNAIGIQWFGPGFNDSLRTVAIGYDSACGPW